MSFGDLIGNREAVDTVRKMLAQDRLPSALLFTGPGGVGKLTFAKMLAHAIHCEQEENDFCGSCQECRKTSEMLILATEDLERRRAKKDSAGKAENLVYFDLQLVEPLGQFILSAQIEKIISEAYAKPFELSQRIFILNDAHRIHWSGVDRLLKILEEPPTTTFFILVCPNASALRATIRSRCTRVTFRALEDKEIQEFLKRKTELTPTERRLAAHLSGGSIGRACSFDLDDYQRCRKSWLSFFEFCLSSKDWSSLFRTTEFLAKDRENFEANLSIAYSLLRDLLVLQATGNENKILNRDLAPHLLSWGKHVDITWISKVSRGLDQAHRQQIRNMNQQLGLDALASEVISASMDD